MKPNRVTFIVSLIIILLISWADIRFLGFEKTYKLPPVVRQAGHYAIFFTTATIGYLNWRMREKWLQWLWVVMYAAVLLFTISIAIAYNLSGHQLEKKWKIVMADVRLAFIGPIPFLVFSLLLNITRQMIVPGKVDNIQK